MKESSKKKENKSENIDDMLTSLKKGKKKYIKQTDEEKKQDIIDIAEKTIETAMTPNENKLRLIYKKVTKELICLAFIFVYLYFIYTGYVNISKETYIIDMNVFSGFLVIISIIFFEKSYKVDNEGFFLRGIEILFLSVYTIVIPRLIFNQTDQYSWILVAVPYIYAIYYIIKSIYIYVSEKRNYQKNVSDISEIVKKKVTEK